MARTAIRRRSGLRGRPRHRTRGPGTGSCRRPPRRAAPARFPVETATPKPAAAPASIWPSIPMFTMPARSPRISPQRRTPWAWSSSRRRRACRRPWSRRSSDPFRERGPADDAGEEDALQDHRARGGRPAPSCRVSADVRMAPISIEIGTIHRKSWPRAKTRDTRSARIPGGRSTPGGLDGGRLADAAQARECAAIAIAPTM